MGYFKYSAQLFQKFINLFSISFPTIYMTQQVTFKPIPFIQQNARI